MRGDIPTLFRFGRHMANAETCSTQAPRIRRRRTSGPDTVSLGRGAEGPRLAHVGSRTK
jgi:hypothetical protein